MEAKETAKPWLPGNSPSELKADGFLNQILRDVPDWIIQEAEVREDTWRFLLGVRGLSVDCYNIFRAAESVLRAQEQLGLMFLGICGANSNPRSAIIDAQRAGDHVAAEKRATRLHHLLFPYGVLRGSTPGLNEKAAANLARLTEAETRRVTKRYGRAGIALKRLPDAEAFWLAHPVEDMMMHWWLRWGDSGFPGLCFYTDEAMSDLMEVLRGRPHPGKTKRDYYCRLRRRLGLERPDYRKPVVVAVTYKDSIISVECKQSGRRVKGVLPFPAQRIVPGR